MRQRYYEIVIVFCLLCVGAMAQEQPAPSDLPLEFILHPVQEGFSEYTSDYNSNIELAFKKEPQYAGDEVRRNALILSRNPMVFIGVAYDTKARQLYIDRNQNLDLTDDGPCITAKDSPYYGRITNVEIKLEHDGIPVPYTMEVYFGSNNYFYATIRSGWRETVEIAGEPCTIGIADNLDGVFNFSDGFQFDHERNSEARLPYGEKDNLPLPKWIVFEGQCYLLNNAFRVIEDETVLAATLTPITKDLMDISFEGQYVSRIMLWDKENEEAGVVEWPLPDIHVPSGNYTLSRVDLLDSFYAYPRSMGALTPGSDTRIKTGGPLKQKISVSRRGRNLFLDYDLCGADSTSYRADNYANRATFAIYKGNRKVTSGNFRYG